MHDGDTVTRTFAKAFEHHRTEALAGVAVDQLHDGISRATGIHGREERDATARQLGVTVLAAREVAVASVGSYNGDGDPRAWQRGPKRGETRD